MKFRILLILLVGSSHLFAQTGTLKESLVVKSQALAKDVEYSIYLPPDYELSNQRYPVLYLLHGYTDDETGWVQFGEVKAIADAAIRSGKSTAMIIVMPDAGVSWYVNNHDNTTRYEDFLVKDFIPYIDQTYRTRKDRSYRAVAGLSMGGLGTFLLALKHPDLVAVAAPLSAAILTDDEVTNMPQENWAAVIGIPFGKDLKGKARLTEHYKSNAPLHLVANGTKESLSTVRWYIDCGDKDFLIKANMAMHAALLDKKVPHEFRVREGQHDWTYWRTALPDVLAFVTQTFHR